MKPIEVSLENFRQEVLESAEPVLVDFWAPWCRPCLALKPVLESLAADGHKVALVNINDEPEITGHFKVGGVPTLMIFKAGRKLLQTAGMQSKQHLANLMAQAARVAA